MATKDDKPHGGKLSLQEHDLRDIILREVNSYPAYPLKW